MNPANENIQFQFDPNIIEYKINHHHILYSPFNNSIMVVGEQIYSVYRGILEGKNPEELAMLCNTDRSSIATIISDKLYSLSLQNAHFMECTKVAEYYDCWLQITNACNLNCEYCYIRKDSQPSNTDSTIHIIDKLLNSCRTNNKNELRIRFSGGEPLLEKELIRQCIHYCEKNRGRIRVHYSLITNGTLLCAEDLNWLNNHHVHVCVSLDGLEFYHDKYRKYSNGQGSFRDVRSTIQFLLENGIETSVMTTVTAVNMSGLPELTRELAKLHGVKFRYSFEKCFRNSGTIPLLITRQRDLIPIILECLNIIEEEFTHGNTDFDFSLCDFKVGRPHLRACGAGVYSIALNTQGDASICGMGLFEGIVVDHEKDYYSAVHNHYLSLIEQTVENKDPCKSCLWKKLCAGGCALNSFYYWNALGCKSPYCETFKSVLPLVVKLVGEKMYYSSLS